MIHLGKPTKGGTRTLKRKQTISQAWSKEKLHDPESIRTTKTTSQTTQPNYEENPCKIMTKKQISHYPLPVELYRDNLYSGVRGGGRG